MKLRRLVMMCALVLVTLIMVAIPSSAGKGATPISATLLNPDWGQYINPKDAGVTLHARVIFTAILASSDDRLNNGVFSWDTQGLQVPNPNINIPDSFWGPSNGVFRIVTSLPGEPESGWEGTMSIYPQANTDKYPRSYATHAVGNGFGIYKGLHIKFSVSFLVWPDYTLSGEIW
jgi:hypothetical protein